MIDNCSLFFAEGVVGYGVAGASSHRTGRLKPDFVELVEDSVVDGRVHIAADYDRHPFRRARREVRNKADAIEASRLADVVEMSVVIGKFLAGFFVTEMRYGHRPPAGSIPP